MGARWSVPDSLGTWGTPAKKVPHSTGLFVSARHRLRATKRFTWTLGGLHWGQVLPGDNQSSLGWLERGVLLTNPPVPVGWFIPVGGVGDAAVRLTRFT